MKKKINKRRQRYLNLVKDKPKTTQKTSDISVAKLTGNATHDLLTICGVLLGIAILYVVIIPSANMKVLFVFPVLALILFLNMSNQRKLIAQDWESKILPSLAILTLMALGFWFLFKFIIVGSWMGLLMLLVKAVGILLLIFLGYIMFCFLQEK